MTMTPKYALKTSRHNAQLWADWYFGITDAKRIVDGFATRQDDVLIPCRVDPKSYTYTKRQAIAERERFINIVSYLKGKLGHEMTEIYVEVVNNI